MTEMRVLQVIDSLDQGGAERSLVDLLRPLADVGVHTDIAVLRADGVYTAEAVQAGATVHHLRGARIARVRALRALTRDLRPDLVHATLFEANLIARTAHAGTRVPVVTSLVGTPYGPDHLAEPGLAPYKVRAVQLVDAVTARGVRRFHANAEHVATTMTHRLRLPRGRVEVVSRGRAAERLGERSPERRAHVLAGLGLATTTRLIVIAARHEHGKGIDLGLHAFAELAADDPHLIVLVAGRHGSATDALRSQIAAAGLDERVRLLGHRDDIADLLAAADVALVPSRREGFPGVVVEAMALEAPVVASDLPGVHEAAGPYAWTAPVGDAPALAAALRAALTDRDDRRSRTAGARQRFLDNFTMPAVATRMAAFYEHALGRPTTDPLRVLNLLNRDHRRGAETFALDLGQALTHEGLVVRDAALAGSSSGVRFPIDVLAPATARWPSLLAATRRAARGVDVVIGHGGRTLFAGAALNRPFVYRVIGEQRYWASSRGQQVAVRLALRRARRVAVYHQGAADELVAHGVHPDRIIVIPKGIDPSAVEPADTDQRVAARRRFGIADSDARAVVLSIGALTPVKNVEQAIAATAPNAAVIHLVVGDGPELARLRAQAATHPDRLIVAGAIDDPVSAFHAADVVVLTSRSEGMPSVLLEAGLAGLPTVATPVGGVSDVVIDGTTGWLVPLDDPGATAAAIERALSQRATLGSAARAHVIEHFALDATARRWAALLAEVAAC